MAVEVWTSTADDRRLELDALFRRESTAVFRTLYAFTGGRRDLAEDATAEAFARAVAHADSIRDPLPWVYRTAFRVALDELRRERRDPRASVDARPEDAGLVRLVGALKRLSPNQRAAIVLRYEADLPVAEVARRMGIASPTVRVHLHRGRRRLRELLGDEEVEP